MKGWNNTRLKNLLNEPLLYGLNVSSEYEERDMPRYIRITDFDDFNNLNEQTFKSLPEEIAQSAQLKDGDLLFARSGASVGKTFLYRPLPNGACYAGYLIRARFDRQRVMPEYVSYYTKSQSYENWKNATYIQATIQNISAERYYQLPISIPPLEEQGRIVSYLNDKTGKIDARVSLLTKKRDAYQRLKKALISRVVTKGLNPNAKFKPSGVDWIGEIPEGWEVKRIKEICDFVSRGTTPDYVDESKYKVINKQHSAKVILMIVLFDTPVNHLLTQISKWVIYSLLLQEVEYLEKCSITIVKTNSFMPIRMCRFLETPREKTV